MIPTITHGAARGGGGGGVTVGLLSHEQRKLLEMINIGMDLEI